MTQESARVFDTRVTPFIKRRGAADSLVFARRGDFGERARNGAVTPCARRVAGHKVLNNIMWHVGRTRAVGRVETSLLELKRFA